MKTQPTNKEDKWPKMRLGQHAACCLGFNTENPWILISGGRLKQELPFKDLWILNLASVMWKQVNVVVHVVTRPSYVHQVVCTMSFYLHVVLSLEGLLQAQFHPCNILVLHATTENRAVACGYHYTNLTVVHPCVRVCVRPESITGSYLTPVKKLVFFASLSFDVTEAVDRNG